jgi:hypothetical protein
MRRILAVGMAFAAAGVGGCTHYHQEVAALRMARPAVESAQLSAYARGEPNYPSVGGNILKGTGPTAAAAYDATSGERVPPPEAPR